VKKWTKPVKVCHYVSPSGLAFFLTIKDGKAPTPHPLVGRYLEEAKGSATKKEIILKN
jgi:hypothetical protein